MKNISREILESGYPSQDAKFLLSFCLDALIADKEHAMHDYVVEGRLSYEELFGALRKAQLEINELSEDPEE